MFIGYAYFFWGELPLQVLCCCNLLYLNEILFGFLLLTVREEQGPETSSWCKQLESSTKYRKQLLQYWVKAEQDYNPQEKKTK